VSTNVEVKPSILAAETFMVVKLYARTHLGDFRSIQSSVRFESPIQQQRGYLFFS
jgi:hypothetical protein